MMTPNNVGVNSFWTWEQWFRGRLVKRWTARNLVTDQGLAYLMTVGFYGGSPFTDWRVLIYENDHTPAAANTYAVPGFTECSAYTEATRPSFTPDTAPAANDGGGYKLQNLLSPVVFTMNATKTIYGAALVAGGIGVDQKLDLSCGGILYCLNAFSGGSAAVESGTLLRVSTKITLKNAV